jgi:hypothetical protein
VCHHNPAENFLHLHKGKLPRISVNKIAYSNSEIVKIAFVGHIFDFCEFAVFTHIGKFVTAQFGSSGIASIVGSFGFNCIGISRVVTITSPHSSSSRHSFSWSLSAKCGCLMRARDAA